jgi:Holliday junction resolvasome RuvABC endonuclease subunit
MNLLALDQASRRTGWAVASSEMVLLDYGLIDLEKIQDQTKKRQALIQNVNELVEKYNIKQIILEGIYKRSVKVYKILAKVQGSLEDFCNAENIICFSWENAGEWRKWIGISNYKKNDKGKMIQKKSEELKEETRKFVIDTYGLTEEVLINKGIDKKYHNDVWDAIGSCDAYFKMNRSIN